MRSELKSEARALLQMYGPVMGRHFSVNIDAGTISDIRDGSLFAYLSPDWVMASTPELTAWAPWSPKEQPDFPC